VSNQGMFRIQRRLRQEPVADTLHLVPQLEPTRPQLDAALRSAVRRLRYEDRDLEGTTERVVLPA
jgi:hypothetical protein